MMFFIPALLILLSACPFVAFAQAAADVGPSLTFRSGVSNVRVDVQVVDGTEIIKDLTQQDFVITDEGQPQKVLYFGRDAEPVSLLLVLDVSGSMRKYVEQVGSVAREALRYLKPKDRVALMIFSKGSQVVTDFTEDLDVMSRDIKAAEWQERLGSGTAINDALVDAAHYMREKAGDSGRKAILILTDNLGLNYKSPDEQVIRSLYESDTVLNAMVVGRGERPAPIRPGHYVNPDFTPPDVFHIADETGGEAVQAVRSGETFPQMIDRIRTRYSLQYRVPENAKSGFRHIKVELSASARLRHPRAEVRARKGYFFAG